MIEQYTPLVTLPDIFYEKWNAQLIQAKEADIGSFELVEIEPTNRLGFQAQRLVVLVVDENGFPMANVPVLFAYDTAEWRTVFGKRYQGDVVPTQGGGQIEHIQGDPVKAGRPGGVSVGIIGGEGYTSDLVTGMGMLADHTGVKLTFQLRRKGVIPFAARLANIEARLSALEGGGGEQ